MTYLPIVWGTEENHDKPHRGYAVSGPTYNLQKSRIMAQEC
jgi:hypothetical protein